MSIRVRVALAITLVFAIGAGAVALFMQQAYERNVQDAARAAIARDSAVFAQLQADDTAKLASTALALQQNDTYRQAFVAGDREGLLAIAAPVFEQLKTDYNITHWYFESAGEKGDVFLRVHKPQQFGDVLKRKTYLAAASTGKPASGLELGATAVALRSVQPYYDAEGKQIIGFMELGQEIDEFLGEIEAQTGDQVGLLLAKESMDSSGWAAMRASAGLKDNWGEQEQYVLASATDEAGASDMTFEEVAEAVDADGEVIGSFDGAEGGTEVRGVFPIEDASGSRIGLVFVRHDITKTADALRSSMLKVLAAVVVMLTLVLGLVVVLMNTLVFGRLDAMIKGMEDISLRLAGGDFDVVYEADGRKDEIGEFQSFFASFISMTAGALKQLSKEVTSS